VHSLANLEHQLRADTRALRSLACDLVGDRHAADDVIQEAIYRAIRQPPPHHLGAWLRTVVRHLCFQHHREQCHRVARERAVARPEQVESASDVAARREAWQAVTAAVFTLDEPYLSTIVLRYFDDLPPKAIAAQTGISVATVKSRLQRGLQQLRARLDRAQGGRRGWQPALAAAIGLPPFATTALLTTGTMLMGPTAKIALGTAAVAAAVVLVLSLGGDPTPTPLLATGQDPVRIAGATTTVAGPAQDGAIERLPLATAAPVEPALLHPFTFDLEIEVRDRDGLPVEGTQLLLAPPGCAFDRVPATSDANGLARAQWRGKVSAMTMALLVEGQPMFRSVQVRAGTRERVVVEGGSSRDDKVAKNFDVVVEDKLFTTPLAKQRQDLEALRASEVLPSRFVNRSSSSELVMQGGMHPYAVFADALIALPGIETFGDQLHALDQTQQRLAIESLNRIIADHAWTPHAVAAVADAAPPTVLEGTVFDDQSRPEANSTVCWGEAIDHPAQCTRTDAQGHFRFATHVRPGVIQVRAGGSDAGLARARVVVTEGKTTSWDAHLRRESTIRGRALDSKDQPLSGWTVEVAGAQAPWFDACTVRKDGTFEMPNQPSGLSTLLLRHQNRAIKLPVALVGDVLPDTGDLLIQFDPATASGRLEIEPFLPETMPGQARVPAEVRVWQEETSRGATMDKTDKASVFSLRGLPAGWYRVEVGATGIGWVDAGRFWVDGSGLVSVGRVPLPAQGWVQTLHPPGALPDVNIELQIYRRRPDLDLRVGEVTFVCGSSLRLPGGDYWLLWNDQQGQCHVQGFNVAAGKWTAVTAGATADGGSVERR